MWGLKGRGFTSGKGGWGKGLSGKYIRLDGETALKIKPAG